MLHLLSIRIELEIARAYSEVDKCQIMRVAVIENGMKLIVHVETINVTQAYVVLFQVVVKVSQGMNLLVSVCKLYSNLLDCLKREGLPMLFQEFLNGGSLLLHHNK